MWQNVAYGAGGAFVLITCWPVIRAILIFVLTLVTGIFGALTNAVGTIPAAPVSLTSPPAVTAPAVSGGEQLILDRMKQDRTEQKAVDAGQNQQIATVAAEVKTVATRVEEIANRQSAPPPTPSPPPCSSNCSGGGDYMELPPGR